MWERTNEIESLWAKWRENIALINYDTFTIEIDLIKQKIHKKKELNHAIKLSGKSAEMFGRNVVGGNAERQQVKDLKIDWMDKYRMR